MSAADPLSIGELLNDPPKQPEGPPKRTRDQRAMPGRVFERIGSGPTWTLLPDIHAGVTEAEAWIEKFGTPGKAYFPLKGPAKALFRPISKTEEVDP